VSTEEKRAQIIVKVALQGSGLPSLCRAPRSRRWYVRRF
jgi:hypothetical protein